MAGRRHKRPPQPYEGKAGRMRHFLAQAQAGHGPANNANGQAAKPGFTMRDEARNTASHETDWGRDSRLRLKPVVFVSAGFIKPLEDLHDKDTPEDAGNKPQTIVTLEDYMTGLRAKAGTGSELEIESPLDPEMAGVAVNDTGGSMSSTPQVQAPETSKGKTVALSKRVTELVWPESGTNQTRGEQVVDSERDVVRSSETTGVSISRKEEVTEQNQANEPRGSEAHDITTDSPPAFFFDLEGDKSLRNRQAPTAQVPETDLAANEADSGEDVILFKGRKNLSSQKAKPRTQHVLQDKSLEDNAISLTEMRYEIDVVEASLPKPGDPGPSTAPQKLSRSARRSRRRKAQRVETDEMDEIIKDYIANMASDDPEDDTGLTFNTQRDLGGDHDAFGIAVPESEDSRAHDYDQQNLGSSTNTSDVDEDEEEGGLDDDDSDGEGEGGGEGDDDTEDDDATVTNIDDETLAKLLAKQEELGIGGDELVLFTDAQAKVKNRRTSRGTKKAAGQFSSPPVEADPFDSLDLMNLTGVTGVPNLRKGRRSKQPPDFNVSDSDIANALRTAWQNDRERKKNRKLAREKLREAGLLGQKDVDPNDLQLKYLEGVSLDNIKTELRDFLLGAEENLYFPPMDKHARAILHKLANRFKIKTQSTGNGDSRRPVLYRTDNTFRYTASRGQDPASDIDRASTRIHRKYFPRPDKKGAQIPRGPRGGGGGGGGGSRSIHAAVTFRDGEIAGASIPKIGEGNRGRTMLEKMGWSFGMALGSTGNEGILEPVAQVIKRTKAGLGQGGRSGKGRRDSDGS